MRRARALPGDAVGCDPMLLQSEAAGELFGVDFVQHFADTREWEEREFRRDVTNWELERYFEAI